MSYAPAISTIISPEYLAEFVRNRYGFDEIPGCRILKTGINHSYLISCLNRKFVLRIYSLGWRTQGEISEELNLLAYLKENDLSVSFPIRDRNNNYIQRIKAFEGERLAVLFSYAEGETIRIPSETESFHLGLAMAKMHQLTHNKSVERKNYSAESLVHWAYHQAKNHFPTSSNEMQYFERASAAISTEFANADPTLLRHGIIHLDLWYENMKIKNGTEFTFFDFDNCGNGWCFLDIAYSLKVLFRNEPDKQNFLIKRASFFQGYESILKISEEERRLIPYGGLAIWLHYSGVHAQRFNDFSNQFLSPEFLKYWIQTGNLWMKFHGIEI